MAAMEARSIVPSAELARLLGSWEGSGPGYTALAGALRTLVLDGRVPLRARLPSERELAAVLGVSRTTTTAAYDLLRGEGFLESRQGSGSRVALPTGGAADRELRALSPGEHAADSIDLSIAAMPAPGAMMDAVDGAARDLAGHLGGTGYDPLGVPSFRREIAEQFTARGVPTSDDQIVVVAGAQLALALLLDVLLAPGDPALVEVPSYPNAIGALRRAGARFVPAAMTDTGWDLDLVAVTFREQAPRVAYLQPDFHNPTGFLMPDDEREAVVREAVRAGTHLVVDETFARLDLEPWRPRPEPMAAHDREGAVITVGSMSKAFWGGLRLGWIRCASPLARRVAQARAAVDLATPVLEQLIAERLLRASGPILDERRRLLAERRDALVTALREELPAWRFRIPRGGLCLWAELERPEAEALAEAADREGVHVVPGTTFSPDGTLDRYLRLPFTLPPDRLREAVSRLALAERRIRGAAAGGSRRDRIA
jgi:DNA-binding transcriptional MocR family regulator